jgi:hypothetical protein
VGCSAPLHVVPHQAHGVMGSCGKCSPAKHNPRQLGQPNVLAGVSGSNADPYQKVVTLVELSCQVKRIADVTATDGAASVDAVSPPMFPCSRCWERLRRDEPKQPR